MTNDPRHSGEQGPVARSPAWSRRWLRSLRTIALTWLAIAAAPALWASVDRAGAGLHEPSAVHAVGTPRQASRPAASRISDWGVRRLNAHA